MIYIASPYSHDNEAVMELRSQMAAQLTAELMEAGYLAISPIVHGHEVQKYLSEKSTDFNYWKNYCLTLLSKCDRMIILGMPGWTDSVGVKAEIEFCLSNYIDVRFYDVSRKAVFDNSRKFRTYYEVLDKWA